MIPRSSKKEFIFKSQTLEQTEKWARALTKALEGSLGKQIQLTSITSYNQFWKVKMGEMQRQYMLESEFRENAQTGSIVLFRGKKSSAVLQRRLTWDEFDHIAVILKNIRDQILLFEATGGSGVGIFPWNSLIKREWYKDQQLIVYRELQIERTTQFLEQIEEFVHSSLGCKYEFSLEKMFRRHSKEQSQNKPNSRTYFCSELVALLYKKLGLLPQQKSSTQYWPGAFSDLKNMELISGKYGPATLSGEVIIVFEPSLLAEKGKVESQTIKKS